MLTGPKLLLAAVAQPWKIQTLFIHLLLCFLSVSSLSTDAPQAQHVSDETLSELFFLSLEIYASSHSTRAQHQLLFVHNLSMLLASERHSAGSRRRRNLEMLPQVVAGLFCNTAISRRVLLTWRAIYSTSWDDFDEKWRCFKLLAPRRASSPS